MKFVTRHSSLVARHSSLAAALAAALVAALLAAAPSAATAGESFEIGIGANYWYSIKEAKDKSFDRDGLGWMLTSRIFLSDFFSIGLEVEQTPEDFVFLEDKLYLPAAYALVGNVVYAGLGIGNYYYDGDFYGDIWYALRAGFKIPILSRSLVLDVNVNYRVEDWDKIKKARDDIDSDTLMVGAALRLAF